MKIFFIQKILILIATIFFVSCKNFSSIQETSNLDSAESLKVLSWNAQTFFDSVTDGKEYSEFIKSKTWCRDFYIERLKRLVKVLKTSSADVIILQEIENEGVMHDINNFLALEWNFKKNYSYAAFSKDASSSIGCGIFSRYPLKDMKVHSVKIDNNYKEMPSLRPLSQISVYKNNRELVILVNHWKSKSGGEEESEIWRNWQEKLLSGLVKEIEGKGKKVLCAGDFNRDINDFCDDQNGSFILRDCLLTVEGDFSSCSGNKIYSAWYSQENLCTTGSYFFNDQWQKIDNFFAGEGVSFSSFEVLTQGDWCDAQTLIPYKYQLWNGSGYSDHLPILSTVRF
jgi:predicted extracellular nuclease